MARRKCLLRVVRALASTGEDEFVLQAMELGIVGVLLGLSGDRECRGERVEPFPEPVWRSLAALGRAARETAAYARHPRPLLVPGPPLIAAPRRRRGPGQRAAARTALASPARAGNRASWTRDACRMAHQESDLMTGRGQDRICKQRERERVWAMERASERDTIPRDLDRSAG